MALRQAGKSAIERGITERKAFRHDNVSGSVTLDSTGSLPDCWLVAITDAKAAGVLAYVVYSYRTPIAWLRSDVGWVVPPVRYSVTTTNHQSALAYALRGETMAPRG